MSGLNLSAGEKVIFQGHPSWRAILGFYLKGVLVAVVIGVIVKLIGSSSALVFLVVLAILAITVLVGFIKRWATTYTITNRRLNIKRGIVSREVQETRLERVQNVNYKQSVYQRAMQVELQARGLVADIEAEIRVLYKGVEVGQEIPADLYRAVAEILAYIYRLMNGRLPG